MTEREQEGFELLGLHFGFAQKELRAADDDLTAVLDVAADGVLDAEARAGDCGRSRACER